MICLKLTLFGGKMSQVSDLYSSIHFSELLRKLRWSSFTVNTGLQQTGLYYKMINLPQRTKKNAFVFSVVMIAFQTQKQRQFLQKSGDCDVSGSYRLCRIWWDKDDSNQIMTNEIRSCWNCSTMAFFVFFCL